MITVYGIETNCTGCDGHSTLCRNVMITVYGIETPGRKKTKYLLQCRNVMITVYGIETITVLYFISIIQT